MEEIPNQTPKDSLKNKPNFHEISEKRKELRKASGEIGNKGAIFYKHYKKPLEEIQEQSSQFKMADFGGLKGAKVARTPKFAHQSCIIIN